MTSSRSCCVRRSGLSASEWPWDWRRRWSGSARCRHFYMASARTMRGRLSQNQSSQLPSRLSRACYRRAGPRGWIRSRRSGRDDAVFRRRRYVRIPTVSRRSWRHKGSDDDENTLRQPVRRLCRRRRRAGTSATHGIRNCHGQTAAAAAGRDDVAERINLGAYYNGSLTMSDVTLSEALRFAYNDVRGSGAGPDWIKSRDVARYQIVAKAAGAVPLAQGRVLTQRLLADRLKVVVRKRRGRSPLRRSCRRQAARNSWKWTPIAPARRRPTCRAASSEPRRHRCSP